jgi:RhoGAP domain
VSAAEYKKKRRAEARRRKEQLKGKKKKIQVVKNAPNVPAPKAAPKPPPRGNPNDLYFKRTEAEVPTLVSDTLAFLQDQITLEGLFRISGESTETKDIRDAYVVRGEENVSFAKKDPHSVAGALKMWLRDLDNPLMTFECYQLWLDAMEEPAHLRVAALRVVMDGIPPGNALTMQALFPFLYKVTQHADKNLMTSDNLALVFAPTLIRSPSDEENAQILMARSGGVTVALVKLLIDNCDSILFGDDDEDASVADPSQPLDIAGGRNNESGGEFTAGFRKSMAVANMQVFRALGRELAGEERLSRRDIADALQGQQDGDKHMSHLFEQVVDEGRHRTIMAHDDDGDGADDPWAMEDLGQDFEDDYYSPMSTTERHEATQVLAVLRGELDEDAYEEAHAEEGVWSDEEEVEDATSFAALSDSLSEAAAEWDEGSARRVQKTTALDVLPEVPTSLEVELRLEGEDGFSLWTDSRDALTFEKVRRKAMAEFPLSSFDVYVERNLGKTRVDSGAQFNAILDHVCRDAGNSGVVKVKILIEEM